MKHIKNIEIDGGQFEVEVIERDPSDHLMRYEVISIVDSSKIPMPDSFIAKNEDYILKALFDYSYNEVDFNKTYYFPRVTRGVFTGQIGLPTNTPSIEKELRMHPEWHVKHDGIEFIECIGDGPDTTKFYSLWKLQDLILSQVSELLDAPLEDTYGESRIEGFYFYPVVKSLHIADLPHFIPIHVMSGAVGKPRNFQFLAHYDTINGRTIIPDPILNQILSTISTRKAKELENEMMKIRQKQEQIGEEWARDIEADIAENLEMERLRIDGLSDMDFVQHEISRLESENDPSNDRLISVYRRLLHTSNENGEIDFSANAIAQADPLSGEEEIVE